MSEFMRNNWFVVVVAVIIIAFVTYFIYDGNKYNVSGRTDSDGLQVLAGIDEADVTAEDLYDQSVTFDSALIYNMYQNIVIDQSVETTDDLKESAKELEDTINANASSSTDSATYEDSISQELATYGFNGYERLYDYCLMTVKRSALQREYITDHFEETTAALEEKSPRTISIISMQVADAENLTDEEQEKKDNIDQALESGTFADAATAFSEDTSTASNDGFYGYIDSDSASSSSNALDSSVIAAALELDKDETSEWITVVSSSTGLNYLYLVHVDETDIETIWNSTNETVSNNILSAVLSANDYLSVRIIQHYAQDLDINFEDAQTEEKLNSYIDSLIGDDSDEEE